MPRPTPKLLRGHCLSLNVVELARRRILVDNARPYGSIRLFTDDPDGDQVAASARGFLSNGGGLVKVVWDRGFLSTMVESRPTAIRGYRHWTLTCGSCGRACKKLLAPPRGDSACYRCLGVRYPDKRRQRSWASAVWLAAMMPDSFEGGPRQHEALYEWGVGEIRRLGLKW